MKTRDEIAREEATRDPIFLLQRRIYRGTGYVPFGYYYCEQCEGTFNVEDGGDEHRHRCGSEDFEPEPISAEEAVESGCWIETWETVGVFLTREEGERYGEDTKHRYGDGWRVYCVCAEGELAALLKSGVRFVHQEIGTVEQHATVIGVKIDRL